MASQILSSLITFLRDARTQRCAGELDGKIYVVLIEGVNAFLLPDRGGERLQPVKV